MNGLLICAAIARAVTCLSGDGWTLDGEPVRVPHTWNAFDAADGKDTVKGNPGTSVGSPSYLRKARKYARALPAPKRDRRYFVRCEGVSSKATVIVNGVTVGRHAGAFTAFAFEITDWLSPTKSNKLEIIADNSYDRDVPPISGDFSLFGGVYRNVWLIETGKTCISPLIDGGPGVVLEPNAETGEVIARVTVDGGTNEVQRFRFPKFELWSPETPVLYPVKIAIDQNGCHDEIELKVGFRKAEFKADGFYLNGKKRQIHGVCRHQDRDGKGWAVSAEDEAEDVEWMKKMGADGVRTAHYPHSTHFFDLCDERGILAWTEVPNIDVMEVTPAYRANLLQVAREMVAQHRHHPSIVVWGLFNELYSDSRQACAVMPTSKAFPILREVVAQLHADDPSRKVTAASNNPGLTGLNSIPDVLGFNLYPGWYNWKPWYFGDDGWEMSNTVARALAATSNRLTFAMSEYGGGASINQHADPFLRTKVNTGFYSEEYQAWLHVGALSAMLDNPVIWGIYPWAMFDLAADRRHEADRHGINNKGLVTYDRKTAKDAFYLYKANWNPEPELHLVGQRMTKTDASSMNVLAFSNVGAATLKVNGQVIGVVEPNRVKTCIWRDVPLAVGENSIEVTAGALVQRAVWTRKDNREKPFAFRQRLTEVHKPNRRDRAAVKAADEFEFVDGCCVGDEDFADYLNVSMGVNASPKRGTVVRVMIDTALQNREYEIEVTAKEVRIAASDRRAIHQALYHLEDLMNLRRAPFLKIGRERRRGLFSPRMLHSGYDVDVFPDGHLAQMAHYGFDAIVVFMKTPEQSESAIGEVDVNDIIRRAKKYGLDTYLYSKIKAFVHPSDPQAEQVFADTYGKLARLHPEAKGIVFVGESCEFPSKDPRTTGLSYLNTPPGDTRPPPGWFPCSDYPEWISAVKAAVEREAPKMEIVFWTYNWGRQDQNLRTDMIRKFPQDVIIQTTFYKTAADPKRNGFCLPCDDYTISFAGPGPNADAESRAAAETGKRVYTMANTGGLTWDFGCIPFEPVPYQWKRRWDGLIKFNREGRLAGLMESHHFGWYPSFIAELAKEAFTEGGIPFDRHLRMIAARDYGEENVERVLAAWQRWSDAIRDYPATDDNEYGPFRIGPAYPFNFGGKQISPAFAAAKDATESVPFPQPQRVMHPMKWMCDLNWYGEIQGLPNLRHREFDRMKEIELLQSVADGFAAGVAEFRAISAANDGVLMENARRMADLGEYCQRAALTGVHIKEGYLAHKAGDQVKLREIATAERENAKATIPLLERNSRLGWEPSMGYSGGLDVLRWKLSLMNGGQR